MKVEATLRNIRITPRKVRVVTAMLLGLPVDEALSQLERVLRRGALPVEKLLRSALANAEHNFDMVRDNLVVSKVSVDEGRKLKRWMPRAQGRATPLWKRSSHIRVVLEEIVEGRRAQRVVSEKKKETKQQIPSEKGKIAQTTTSGSSTNSAPRKSSSAPSARRVFQRKAS